MFADLIKYYNSHYMRGYAKFPWDLKNILNIIDFKVHSFYTMRNMF